MLAGMRRLPCTFLLHVLRYVRSPLISLIGFPAMLDTLVHTVQWQLPKRDEQDETSSSHNGTSLPTYLHCAGIKNCVSRL